jgi:hypothetical protein
MIIIYLKDAADVNDCHLHMALPHINSLEEKSGELYAGVRNDPVVSDIARVGWFAVPEQPLPPPTADIKTVNDVALASIKTINDVAIASVKTVNEKTTS